MAKSETLHIRVDPDVKADVEAMLSTLGLSTTEAVNIFLHQILLVGGLPFEVKYPQYNAETLAAMREARDIATGKIPVKSYNSVAELMEDLNSDDED
ncbi:type II toxin-antitoxin system RelB/DinJ family antitoxin [Desulfosporosinus sp. PR]|uniref:type II toxin-antitoxin system RelB/DinJ family antitoxin n=1 Tax=Candidatus Desulfosporosinus nitrosoreducens TaxID=3401928 RepID=UPI0027EAE343|nr:type II toxin-antitoxin system RelB/DinJ family antitoxin [Desulfosporosinus sp. PR]MDQ7095029.1 type II toxin-antitoxin system RelB/DinJ family antitoxin [Desulfosporosinus sp. PR]